MMNLKKKGLIGTKWIGELLNRTEKQMAEKEKNSEEKEIIEETNSTSQAIKCQIITINADGINFLKIITSDITCNPLFLLHTIHLKSFTCCISLFKKYRSLCFSF